MARRGGRFARALQPRGRGTRLAAVKTRELNTSSGSMGWWDVRSVKANPSMPATSRASASQTVADPAPRDGHAMNP